MNRLYTATATSTGGRDRRVTGADGHPDLLIKPPAELGGPAERGGATNPEELFALGCGNTVCPYSKATRGNIGVARFVGDDPV